MGWTDKKILDLKSLWVKGLTTLEIGKRLGISKNAVVGKAHRLGLKGRPSPIKRHQKAVPPKKKARVFKLIDLSSQTCRWPIGDPKHDNFHFCGDSIVPGKPYCAGALRRRLRRVQQGVPQRGTGPEEGLAFSVNPLRKGVSPRPERHRCYR